MASNDLPSSEADYLSAQLTHSKAALRNTLSKAHESLRSSDNLAQWAADHPWVSLGAAVFTGFVAAGALSSDARHPVQKWCAAANDWLSEPDPTTAAPSVATPPAAGDSLSGNFLAAFRGKFIEMLRSFIPSGMMPAATDNGAPISAPSTNGDL